MKYYLVPRKLDQYQVYSPRGKYCGVLLAGELITESECRKRHIDGALKNKLLLISLPSRDTFVEFGARFPAQEVLLHTYRCLYVDEQWRKEYGMG